MNEDEIKKELNKAAGSIEAENIDVTESDKDKVLKIIQKYQNSTSNDAIESLLYGIQAGLKTIEEEKNNGRTK